MSWSHRHDVGLWLTETPLDEEVKPENLPLYPERAEVRVKQEENLGKQPETRFWTTEEQHVDGVM